MVARYEHHVSPITGIVPELLEVTADGVTHVCRAGQSSPRPAKDWQSLVARRRSNASGKGVRTIESKASALGEALERYSSHWDGTETVVTASYAALGPDAVHPNACMLFSESQLQHYNRTNKHTETPFKRRVVKPFDDDQPIDWIKAWSLSHQQWRYVAAGCILFGYPQPNAHRYCMADSNGNAAGTCLLGMSRKASYRQREQEPSPDTHNARSGDLEDLSLDVFSPVVGKQH